MDKTEQQDIVRTIKMMHKNHDYHGILALTKDVNPDRIKDRRALEMIADAYNKSGLYKEAREYLLIAYERFSQSRGVAYKLAIISVKLGNLDDAVDFYEDFCRLAPSDNNRYILKYIIGRAGGIEAKDLIRVLEIYNQKESDDKWMYELARLYHEVGRVDDCVALCDEIALWYADGDYEKPALELKFMHKSLSASQQARYEQIMSEFVDEPSQPETNEASDEEIILEEEAESFVSEFIDAKEEPKPAEKKPAPLYEERTEKIFTEATGKDPSVETFRIPVDKVNDVLEGQKRKDDTVSIAFSEVDEKINEILGNRQKNINRPRSFSDADFAAVRDEIIKEAQDKEEAALREAAVQKESAQEEAAQEPAKEPAYESAAEEILQKEADAPEKEAVPAKEEAAKEPEESVFAKQAKQLKEEPIIIEATHEDAAYGKLGVSSLKRSGKATLIKKPSLSGKRTFIDEPILKENVDISNIPIGNEGDGQIGINLVLLDKNDNDTIEGQLTIDEFFEQYAGKVAESKDHVAAVEAERVRQILEAVKGMEPTPLYDMNFDTPDEEEFSEEEIITIVSDDEINASASEDVIAKTVAQILESGPATVPEADDITQALEEGALDELLKEEEAALESEEPLNAAEEYEEEAEEENPDAVLAAALAAAAAQVIEEAPEEETAEEPVQEEEAEVSKEPAQEITGETAPEEAEEIPEEAEETAEEPEEISEETEKIPEETEEVPEEEPVLEAVEEPEEAAQEDQQEAPGEVQQEAPGEAQEEAVQKIPAAESEEGANEIMDEGLAAALAKFEASMAQEGEEEEADEASLFGFGDDLADLIMGTAALEETKEEDDIEEPAFEENKEEISEAIEDEVKEEIKEETQPAQPAKAPAFAISDEFREELKEFLLIDGIEEEITTACAQIAQRKVSGDPTGGNLIITGDKKSGKTYLAIAVIKAVIKAVGIGSGRVVKVQAQPLNGKNISAVLKKIEGRDLIIENVGYLKDETIEELLEVVKNGEFKQMIVLEGNTVAIENIILHFPEVPELFASRINIHELTITQWANIAKRYAKEQGYIIDDMAALALHARIDKINVPNARLGLGDIKDIVDSAISKASKRNNGRLFAAFSKKSKEEIYLTESDFTE